MTEARERVAVFPMTQPGIETARRYMPANYDVAELDGRLVIGGKDVAGWTLDGYVIPRLASGLYFAEEVLGKEAAVLYSRLVLRLAGEAEELRSEMLWAQDARA